MGAMLNNSSRSRRNRKRGHGFTDINVTPMVDVMLVLLIVFMVAAPMLTVGVPVDLPRTKAAQLNDQVEPIVVSVDAAGKSYLQEAELTGEALIVRLQAITGSNPDAKIYVRGDQKLAYGRIMEVMGEIASAGFHKVSLIAEMPMGPSKAKAPMRPQAPARAPQRPIQPQPQASTAQLPQPRPAVATAAPRAARPIAPAQGQRPAATPAAIRRGQ